MKGREVNMNPFATAVSFFPPFHGLFLEDHIPATARMTAKITATTGLTIVGDRRGYLFITPRACAARCT